MQTGHEICSILQKLHKNLEVYPYITPYECTEYPTVLANFGI